MPVGITQMSDAMTKLTLPQHTSSPLRATPSSPTLQKHSGQPTPLLPFTLSKQIVPFVCACVFTWVHHVCESMYALAGGAQRAISSGGPQETGSTLFLSLTSLDLIAR